MINMENKFRKFKYGIKPNYQGLLDSLRRKGTPDRVYHMELFLDKEIIDAIDKRFGLTTHISAEEPFYEYRQKIEVQRFLGYDYVRSSLNYFSDDNTFLVKDATDTAEESLKRKSRSWRDESKGPITSWEEFNDFPWPDKASLDISELEWYEENLPDDMCVIAGGGHFFEHLSWFMGYETLCFALHDRRDLVDAIAAKIFEYEETVCRKVLEFEKVKIFWASDDMGFKTGTLISPEDMRHYVLSGHKKLARISHEKERLYILHSCGKRDQILEDLIENVRLDAIHSWEDGIELITDAKNNYGDRLSLIGGIDMDFLCRSDEESIRKRVRETIKVCQPGGGFCLGTGNTVANYVPLDNYLVMIDEGRKMSI